MNAPPVFEPIGSKLRRRRLRHGFTLDELAAQSGVSKPYLSLIENNRLPNPPSDQKLRRLEQTLGFVAGELVTQAHVQRTPPDVKEMLGRLLEESDEATKRRSDEGKKESADRLPFVASSLRRSVASGSSINLDDAYLSGMLHQMVERHGANVETVRTNAVPVINKVAAGYPTDFTDLSYPRGVADDYVGCPDVSDKDAFAARVHGDSMTPKYRPGDIVIFSPAADPRNGDDCFVRFADGQTTFKRVFFESNEASEPMLRLQPRNEKYPPLVIASTEVTGIYRAMYKYERVDE